MADEKVSFFPVIKSLGTAAVKFSKSHYRNGRRGCMFIKAKEGMIANGPWSHVSRCLHNFVHLNSGYIPIPTRVEPATEEDTLKTKV